MAAPVLYILHALSTYLMCSYFSLYANINDRHFSWCCCQPCSFTDWLDLSLVTCWLWLHPLIFVLKQILSSCHCSLQCPASSSLLTSLYGHLQRPAGLRGWPCSDGILRSGSSPGGAACGLCPLCCLSEPPGPPWVCLQAAWAPGSPSAYYHPADVPGVLGHGQSSFASLMFLPVSSYMLSSILTCYTVICLNTMVIWTKSIYDYQQDNYSYGRPAAVNTFENKQFYQTSIASAQRTPTEAYYQTGETFLKKNVLFSMHLFELWELN